MNQDSLRASSKIARLREKFFDGLSERVAEAQRHSDALKANANDHHAAQGLKTVFHKLKGVSSVFGFVDLGILAARGEELMDVFLDAPPSENNVVNEEGEPSEENVSSEADESGEENTSSGEGTPNQENAQILNELDAYMAEFNSAIQAILDEPREDPAPGTSANKELTAMASEQESNRVDTPSVVIVDDDALIRSVLRAMLHGEDYQVLGDASNGKDALMQCDKLNPDLLLLDINMPGADGLNVLKRVRREFPSIRVIMVSAEGSMDKVSSAINAGAAGFIVKPFNEAKVLKQVNRYFKGKSN